MRSAEERAIQFEILLLELAAVQDEPDITSGAVDSSADVTTASSDTPAAVAQPLTWSLQLISGVGADEPVGFESAVDYDAMVQERTDAAAAVVAGRTKRVLGYQADALDRSI
eukprot:8131-Heterococcus_DN1.PRE.1